MAIIPRPRRSQMPFSSPARRLLARCASVALALGAFSTASATTYYQTVNQSGGGAWTDTTAWNTSDAGTGTAPTLPFSSTDDFIANKSGFGLRTPIGASTFGGKTLTLGPLKHSLIVKSGTSVALIPSLITSGEAAINSGTNNSTLTITNWVNNSPIKVANHSAANALFPFSVGTLLGTGDIEFTGSATGVLKLSITDATSFQGTIKLTSGKLQFINALSSAGSFVVANAADVTVSQPVIFTGLSIAGNVIAPGTYNAVDLGFLGTSTFTVRTAATWYLTTNQASNQNWTTAYLSNWNSQFNGTGVAPTNINPFDNYVNQGANRELRTPTVASTFGGGSLSLTNTSKLSLKTPAGAVSTIPALITAGTPSIANAYGNVRQDVTIGDWEITSGTTKLSASAGRSIALNIDYLTGSGGIQTQSGGAFFLKAEHGTSYTGTIDHASGSLRFENSFSTGGALNIGASATVYLDQRVFFTSLTINGVAKAAGVYTYAALNAAHPAQFPTGVATGAITVYTPTPYPATMRGVNLSGPESTGNETTPFPGTYGYQWIYPTAADLDYYHSKGMNLIRLPFRWERIQTSPTSLTLISAELTRMDTLVAQASARGMKVILDMHNYARWRIFGATGYTMGDANLPYSAYGNVWRLIADHYKNEPAIYGYDIMNEPNGLGSGVWVTAAQTAVNSIREVDFRHPIIVEGQFWANAWNFDINNPTLHTVRDPLNLIIFSAHSYWSDSGTDDYKSYDLENGARPEMGKENVEPFVKWLKKYNFKGFVGEYCVPNGDPRWNVVLENFLQYIEDEGISGTYWAGGAWLSGHPTSCHPLSGVDRDVMATMDDHP